MSRQPKVAIIMGSDSTLVSRGLPEDSQRVRSQLTVNAFRPQNAR